MVKIVEIEEKQDTDGDDDCYEIDPTEFAMEVRVKVSDDVFLADAKGQENVRKTLDSSEDDRYEISNFQDSLHESVGDRNKHDLRDEGESSLCMVRDDEDEGVLDMPSAKYEIDDHDDAEGVVEDEADHCWEMDDGMVDRSPAMYETDYHDDGKAVEDEYDHCCDINDFSDRLFLTLSPKHKAFDDEDNEDVVIVRRDSATEKAFNSSPFP